MKLLASPGGEFVLVVRKVVSWRQESQKAYEISHFMK